MSSITSANAIYMLGISSLFPVPQQLQGFSADDVFSTDPLEVAETMMGVDGVLSGGFVFSTVVQGISLQADSASNDVFDQWWNAQRQIRDLYYANGTVILPSVGKKYTLTKGILKTYPAVPDAGKTLKPRKFTIHWQSVTLAPVQ